MKEYTEIDVREILVDGLKACDLTYEESVVIFSILYSEELKIRMILWMSERQEAPTFEELKAQALKMCRSLKQP